MASDFAKANLTVISDTQLKNLTDSYDAIILNTSFEVNDIGKTSNEAQILEFVNQTIKTIDIAKNLLKDGGLLFVYGLTNYLAYLGEYLDKLNNKSITTIFLNIGLLVSLALVLLKTVFRHPISVF